ncbi:hypothetical protein FS837_009158 [Tulasnella sp. UAMH 9824]|nr:hypothetical protein FS837_009158 [Tulasnella sp. UAMH 9824]
MAATATDELPDDKLSPQGSGNLLFGNLAADLAHSIFQHVLELDRIHVHNTPLGILSQLRKTIFTMRCVSALWNRFILSSPQYWCIINVRAPQAAMVKTIERAQAVPLCIYSAAPDRWEAAHFDQILPLLIRHLNLTAWCPKPDVTWIQGLETLVVRDLDGFGPDLYRVLGRCAHGLRHLSLGLASTREELPRIPAAISIPLLEELRLDMADCRTAMEVTRRILVPPSAGGVIWVTLEPRDLDATHDLFDFLFPEEQDILNSRPAVIEIDSEKNLLLADYPRGNRAVQMRVRGTGQDEDYEVIRDVIQYLDLRLGHPINSVTISFNAPYDAKMLKLFSSNIQSISIITGYPEDLAQFLKETIARQSAENSEQADAEDGYWLFQSVRCLAIDCNYSELEDLEEKQNWMGTPALF